MKKIVAFLLLLCTVVSFAACSKPVSTAPTGTTPESAATESLTTESSAPVITTQEIYDAGKSLVAMLGEHESVHVLYTDNKKVVQENYLNKDYSYSFYSGERLDGGSDTAFLTTNAREYYCSEGNYALLVTLAPDGMIDMSKHFAEEGTSTIISPSMLNATPAITEKDGSILATFTVPKEELEQMGVEGAVSCEETYTIDATTREMTSIKTVYRYEDERVDESTVTIARDAEMPEGMKAFLAYEQETENLRTITVISNPGTENEKTESIQTPKGLLVSLSPDVLTTDKLFEVFADAACTQPLPGEPDTNSDATIYVKWVE